MLLSLHLRQASPAFLGEPASFLNKTPGNVRKARLAPSHATFRTAVGNGYPAMIAPSKNGPNVNIGTVEFPRQGKRRRMSRV
jgi:hypothetical protein